MLEDGDGGERIKYKKDSSTNSARKVFVVS